MMPTSAVRQAGAIPLRGNQVCVVSSRSGKRWVVPKGWLDPGKTAGEVALMEAWEEAGLTGVLRPEPAGSYLYEKDGRTFHVTVFVLEVTGAADDWPECGVRERLWLNPPQAIARIEDEGLREILQRVAGRPAGMKAAMV